MANQNKLGEVLKKRNPLEERQIIKPVDVLETEQANRSNEPNAGTEQANRSDEPNDNTERTNRTHIPNGSTERLNRSHEPFERTIKPNAPSERMNRTVFDDLEEGAPEETKRPTERYSFEIYTDQKESIEEVQYLYKKKTGKKLSASRIIREALEEYLTRARAALRQEERE